MRIARLVMIVAAVCFAAGSLTAAQGRGNGPAGRGPQIARGGSAGPNVGGGRTGGGKSGNAGVTSSDSGKHGGNTGPTPGNAGDRGKNAGSGGRGNTDDDQDTPAGGRRRGGSDRKHGAAFVAKMNPQLRARLEAMLPSGVTLDQAAEGFRNQGQFIAALQQSRNHDIAFGDLKTQMTGDNPLSLGEAMRKLGVETDAD